MFKTTLSCYILLCILTLAVADKLDIDEKLQILIKNQTALSGSDRILPQNIVNRFVNYGCWCYFNDNVGRGKGQPVDEFDGSWG